MCVDRKAQRAQGIVNGGASLKVKVPPEDTGLPTALDVTETVTVT